MANGFRVQVPASKGEPTNFGLLGDCIEVRTVSGEDLHMLNGIEGLSIACAPSNAWEDCPPAQFPNPASKTFTRPKLCQVDPVTIYEGTICSTLGVTFDEMNAFALNSLHLGEQRALEDFYMRRILTGPTGYAVGNDLTPASGALSIACGIGLLEGWLATNYGGKGVLHIPAALSAPFSRDHIAERFITENHPETLLGNCIVMGAGYMANLGPDGTPAPSGEAWVYITPPVTVYRDEPHIVTRNESQSINTSVNDRYALAESTFVIETVCCMAAAVRVVIC